MVEIYFVAYHLCEGGAAYADFQFICQDLMLLNIDCVMQLYISLDID